MSSKIPQTNKILLEEAQKLLNDIKNDINTIKNDITYLKQKLNEVIEDKPIIVKHKEENEKGWFF